MPSGPKKRKAAKRKQEALGIHVDGSTMSSIPSPGNASGNGSEMASPVTPEDQGVKAKEVKEEACAESGGAIGLMEATENSECAVEQPALTHEAKEIVDAFDAEDNKIEGDTPQASEAGGESTNEDMGNGKGDDHVVGKEVSGSKELKKSVYAAEPSCIVERPVSLIKEVRSSEVAIEKVGESVSVDVTAAEEQVGKIEALSSVDPAIASGKQKKVASSSGNPIEELQPDCTEEKVPESGSMVALPPQVARKASWLSCCGLFDAFTGSNR